MHPKKDLNNTQRKMLDEIYSDQFDLQKKTIIARKKEERKPLENKILTAENKNPKIKKAIKAINDAKKIHKEVKDYLIENGLELRNADIVGYNNSTIETKATLVLKDSYNDEKHKDLQKFNNELRDLEISLSEKRKEIRSRIYGMATNYEDVKEEIELYIKHNIK